MFSINCHKTIVNKINLFISCPSTINIVKSLCVSETYRFIVCYLFGSYLSSLSRAKINLFIYCLAVQDV